MNQAKPSQFFSAGQLPNHVSSRIANVPVLSVVLTPHHFHEESPHEAFFKGHLRIKGVEAGNACARTLENLEHLAELDAA
jgi:hypothetical protein